MSINSKYFDSIRIRQCKKVDNKLDTVPCQWHGCNRPGLHRAPSRHNGSEPYFYFCIKHVREYNENFNYFSDLLDSKIYEKRNDSASTRNRAAEWEASSGCTMRASQNFSCLRSGTASYQKQLHNSSNIFFKRMEDRPRQRKLKTLEAKAFMTLGLDDFASGDRIKERYKTLVKLHHPDSNGGDRSSETRLREVLQAYNFLKKAGFC